MKHSYRFLFCLLFSLNSYLSVAQNIIYTQDNQIWEGKIIELKSNKLRYEKLLNFKLKACGIKYDNVLMVFDHSGRFAINLDNEQTFISDLEKLVASGEEPNKIYQYDKIITNKNIVTELYTIWHSLIFS